MSYKQIKLQIYPDGKVKADIIGFKGKKCIDYISVLEQLLDAETIDSEWTQEYLLEDSLIISDEITMMTSKQSTKQGV
jgi:hypothetical protein